MEKRKIINLGIVAHADAGKTTLTEQILYLSGAIRTLGSVDEGTASTDTLAVERQRGISVRAACASVIWNNTQVNFIDAPGHSDFLSEVERSLSVLDGAVLVISSVEGVQAQTRVLLEAIKQAKLPCFLFLNKCDRSGSRGQKALEEAQALFGLPCLSLSQIEEEGSPACRLSPLRFQGERLEQAVMACGDEALLETYLEALEQAQALLPSALQRAVSGARLVPVLWGASKYGLGVKELLDALTLYLEEPVPVQEEFCARVYQVVRDPAMGKAAYLRIFSGSIKNREPIALPGGQEEKITRIRKVIGRRPEDAEGAGANEIALVFGLSSVKAGDLLGRPYPGLRSYRLCEPLMLVKARAEEESQALALMAALQALCEEDPALQLEWNREKREAWVRLTGKIQMEVLEAQLRERWGIAARLEEPSVIYRETPKGPAEGFEAYLAPKPCWAVVKFLLEPLPRGQGIRYESKVSPNRLPYRYQAHVETALREALSQGLLGWEVTDMKVTLLDGESHHVHTHPLDFFVATPMAFMDGLRRAGSQLLEPIVRLELTAPEEYLGRAVSLLVARRGQLGEQEISEGYFHLSALAPAAETFDLPAEFAAATNGLGVCGSRFSHYEECPPGVGSSRERLGPDPLDRPRFILAARSALTVGN